ncbi:hypothetical protein [Enterobacter mori]|uniref:hypothetical protein n=1 Tax=Enterobacter mori TaxID=539813 RepID=UPI0020327383|nr:hypothetical protein [Enterobacter mori]MCW4856088.1 hypothetical protein [Enterobacter mori]
MSAITKEFTKEQLQQIEAAAKEVLWPVVWSEKKAREHFSEKITPKVVLKLARIALASLEAEPVCVIDQSNLDYLKSGSDADVWPASRAEMGDVLLYRSATPVPVSVPAAMEMDDDFDSAFEHGKAVGWNAYRAAMLQGVDGKPELTVWYGDMPETNGKTNWTAILHRKGECLSTGITIERSEYPDRVRYEADRMSHLIGELDNEPDILAYDADAHSGYVNPGNSPVIKDDVQRMDWLVSKTVNVREPLVYGSHNILWSQAITDEQDDHHATKLREQIDAAMEAENAAAPQQEVK